MGKVEKKTLRINRQTLSVEFDKGVGVLIPLKYENWKNKLRRPKDFNHVED